MITILTTEQGEMRLQVFFNLGNVRRHLSPRDYQAGLAGKETIAKKWKPSTHFCGGCSRQDSPIW
jgi:hypothetical protein